MDFEQNESVKIMTEFNFFPELSAQTTKTKDFISIIILNKTVYNFSKCFCN